MIVLSVFQSYHTLEANPRRNSVRVPAVQGECRSTVSPCDLECQILWGFDFLLDVGDCGDREDGRFSSATITEVPGIAFREISLLFTFRLNTRGILH